MQAGLFAKAKAALDDGIVKVTKWEEVRIRWSTNPTERKQEFMSFCVRVLSADVKSSKVSCNYMSFESSSINYKGCCTSVLVNDFVRVPSRIFEWRFNGR